MRAFLLFLALMAVCLVAGALLAYPVYHFVHGWQESWPLHRVATRLATLFLVIGLVWLLRRLHVASRTGLGYGLPDQGFMRSMWRAFGFGIVSMLPVVAMLFALDIRELRPHLDAGAVALTLIVIKAGTAALVIAFTEETFFRGALHSAIERESGTRYAIVLTALLYAAMHFLNSANIPHAEASPDSAFRILGGSLQAFATPGRIFDSALALAAVGVLLGLVRVRTGNIAACIGLHAGWVLVIMVTRKLTYVNHASPWAFLVGSYDGVVGYLVLVWTLVLTALLFRYWRPRSISAAPA